MTSCGIMWENIVTSIGASGLASFGFQKWFEHRLEAERAALAHKRELELTEFKNKLELAAAERNFRFSHVFDKTAEAIDRLHLKLVELKDAINAYNMTHEGLNEEQKKEFAKLVQTKWQAFEQSFKHDKLYIRKSTAEQIRQFTHILSKFQSMYKQLVSLEKSPTVSEQTIDYFDKHVTQLMYDIPKLLSALEDDFQEVLGFPIQKQLAEEPKQK